MNSTVNGQRVKGTISPPRLSTYERETSNLQDALELYLWNANTSGAFFPCLHICEVTIRNAVSEVLFKLHGNQWPWDNGFVNTLPNPRKGDNPRRNLEYARDKSSDVNKVIPELSFVFWQNMLTSRHDDRLWLPHFRSTFPNTDNNIGIKTLRGEMHKDLGRIRKLRNRIAHHEPIFSRKLDEDYEAIIKVIGYRCEDTAQWLSLNQNVVSLLNKNP